MATFPAYRAHHLEAALKTPAKIFYKYEGVSPAGSHKPNTAIPQAYYNMKEGIKRLATETGAGQWGSALSLACNYFDLNCTVYMVKDQLPAKTIQEISYASMGRRCNSFTQQQNIQAGIYWKNTRIHLEALVLP